MFFHSLKNSRFRSKNITLFQENQGLCFIYEDLLRMYPLENLRHSYGVFRFYLISKRL